MTRTTLFVELRDVAVVSNANLGVVFKVGIVRSSRSLSIYESLLRTCKVISCNILLDSSKLLRNMALLPLVNGPLFFCTS